MVVILVCLLRDTPDNHNHFLPLRITAESKEIKRRLKLEAILLILYQSRL